MLIFVHGKQKRVRRPPTVDGMDGDDFIRQNADSSGYCHGSCQAAVGDPCLGGYVSCSSLLPISAETRTSRWR
jgi:hypothetical protein